MTSTQTIQQLRTLIRRPLAATAPLALAAILSTSSAFADNFHFLNGPIVLFQGTTVTASGTAAGLGNDPLTAYLSATGQVTALCRNHGGNIAPGQNPVLVSVTAPPVTVTPLKDGSASYSVSATLVAPDPSTISATAAGCPNGNWTVTQLTGLRVTSATHTIAQNGQIAFGPQVYLP